MAPGTGRFMIISAVPPSLSIGADNFDNSATKDVLSDGEMRVWSLKEEGNVYKIVLDENWYSTNEKDNVAVQTSVDPGTRWVISQVSPDEFRIETATPILPNMAWTLTGDNPKSSVVLRSTLGGSDPHQYWRFPTAAHPLQPLVPTTTRATTNATTITTPARNRRNPTPPHPRILQPPERFRSEHDTVIRRAVVKLSTEGATNGYPCCIFLASKLPMLCALSCPERKQAAPSTPSCNTRTDYRAQKGMK
ncbi:hypothetical protein BU15DRAFT_69287 [Melanogaster broomeanus]|nr:hypothetical protein BU15DRAFT_69287 [Melanogaster broomeanus]